MIGNRTLLSLAQYLDQQNPETLAVLFEKHAVKQTWDEWSFATSLQRLIGFLRAIPASRLVTLLDEVVATEPDLCDHVVNQWGDGAGAYNVRWGDLLRCLALDNLVVSKGHLIATEPDLPGATHVEDALTAEISASGLPSAQPIADLLVQSENAFRQVPPDYNACLSNARAALQTLATEIAQQRQTSLGGSFQADKWGQVLSHLRKWTLITKNEEDLISSVYTFISPGAHQPVGLSQEEMVRLGRGMAVSICYFLVKLHNGQAAP